MLGRDGKIPDDGSLVAAAEGKPNASSNMVVDVRNAPLAVEVRTKAGAPVQLFKLDPTTGVLTFQTGTGPLLALGQGGPQFDRRGVVDTMRSGQGGYKLRTHGGKVPIQWLSNTGGN